MFGKKKNQTKTLIPPKEILPGWYLYVFTCPLCNENIMLHRDGKAVKFTWECIKCRREIEIEVD